jgi:hypothetical protein
MRAEQSVSAPRRNQLAVSTAFRGPSSDPNLPRMPEGVIMTSQSTGHPRDVGFIGSLASKAMKSGTA